MATLAQLQAAKSYSDLAAIFSIPAPSIAHAIYAGAGGYGYHRFDIPKRNGGGRSIEAPTGVRRLIQKQLEPILIAAYQPSSQAHGFIADRSVASNARPHVGRRSVVNVDLKDFFHSITFKRIRGVLLAAPFRFDWRVATILAQACCCDGRLPMGGITSPVLSNLVAARLDKRLDRLCSRIGGTYTRYADDLTFSFDRPLSQLSGIVSYDSEGKPNVGPMVIEVLSQEGFQPNPEKFHVAEKSSRKVVTGVVVNSLTNVRRDWHRELESTIYAIGKFGLSHVAGDLYGAVENGVAQRLLLRKVQGKLAYMMMLRGKGDWVVADLAHRFNKVCADPMLMVPDTELVTQEHRIERPLLVVFGAKSPHVSPDAADDQGTAFVRSDGVIVTGAHVIIDDKTKKPYPHIFVSQYRLPARKHACTLLHVDAHRDLAFLKLTVHDADVIRSRFRLGNLPDIGDSIVSVGFPDYLLGNPPSRQRHSVTLMRTASGVRKGVITGTVEGGLSGGPVLNSLMQVVGVVHRGKANKGFANEFIGVNEIRASYP